MAGIKCEKMSSDSLLIVQVQPAHKGDLSRPRHRSIAVLDELIVLVPFWDLLAGKEAWAVFVSTQFRYSWR